MSLQDVEKKVLAAARKEAKEILDAARKETRAETERRRTALREEQERRIAAAKAQAEADLDRDVGTRRADHGMAILQVKNDILDAVFARARERVLHSDGFDYGAWLARQVRQAVEAGSGTLRCNERDRATVQAVLDEAGAEKVSLAEEPAPMQGGVLFESETFDLDLTLESALRDFREELTVELAERLFAEVPGVGGPAAADEGA